MFSVYKQQPGAVRDTGEVLEPGWYWVAMRDTENEPMQVGREYGPFNTYRAAAIDARATLGTDGRQ